MAGTGLWWQMAVMMTLTADFSQNNLLKPILTFGSSMFVKQEL